MGVLELIKINRIKITTVHYVEDILEYDECGLEMKFTLNEDYVPGENISSEFDSLPKDENEENNEEKNEI